MKFDHLGIEKKWQERWEKERPFEVKEDPGKLAKKMYVLDMFPYPSAQGLHVGHPEGYTATDIYSRYLRANGLLDCRRKITLLRLAFILKRARQKTLSVFVRK